MSFVKRTALNFAKGTGLFQAALASSWRRNRLVILCYHSVSLADEHQWNPYLYVSAEFLEQRLEFLKRGHYNILPLSTAVEALYDGNLPPRSVVLTFDDGTTDFHSQAVPILQRFSAPATVYFTTYYSGKPIPVFPMILDYILWKASAPADRDLRWTKVLDLAKVAEDDNFTVTDKNEYARKIAEENKVDFDWILANRILQIMTPAEAAACAKLPGIDVQLHTHRHRTPDDQQLFLREITDNRREIVSIGAPDPGHFCYPSGVYRRQFLPWLKQAGVRSAVTCNHALATKGDDPLLLPRILDHMNLPDVELEAWLTGVRQFLPNRWKVAVEGTED